ncbi:conserved protein of unknown function [Tenacibaculum soleae]|uniref:CdaR family protein n=1 Tax=Tenacibaculum soleae TaxID=447689 RepID=UPI003AB11989
MKKKLNIPKTFFGFLLASVFFWLLINLSKEYTTEITIDTVYTNLPVDKTIIATPIKKIILLVKGSGFKLISTNLTSNALRLDLKKINKKKATDYYFLTKKIQTEIQDQLKSGIKLISTKRDTIPLKIGTLHSKKVPIKTDLDITFQLGHDLAKPINLNPDSVLISGEQSLLKEINFLNLQSIKLENVSESTTINTTINVPKNIKATISNVKVNIIVDKFTEGETEIPILIKNAPKGINIFPKKVKITYKVGLKNFNKVNPSLFKVVCDYNQVKNNEASFLTPKIVEAPNFVTQIRVSPKKIDFLIHK